MPRSRSWPRSSCWPTRARSPTTASTCDCRRRARAARPALDHRRATQAASPIRQCGRRGVSGCSERSTEYAGRGAGRPSSAVVIRRTRLARPRLREDRLCEVGPRAIAVRGDVVDAVRKVEHPGNRRREVAHVGRRPALVVHHRHLVVLLREPQHRAHEVVAGRAEQPGGADDPAVPHLALAGELRPAVDAERAQGGPTRRTARPSPRRRRSRSRSRRAAPRKRRRSASRGRSPSPRPPGRTPRRRRPSRRPRAGSGRSRPAPPARRRARRARGRPPRETPPRARLRAGHRRR